MGIRMKTAIYIEQGLTQFVLTPETSIDKKVLEAIRGTQKLETYQGSFYDCRGGYKRQNYNFGMEEPADSSLIFVVRQEVTA